MARSLKISPQYIQKAKSALKRNGYPSQKAFAVEVGISLSTFKNFLGGKPVDYLNFVEICEKLALDWKEITDSFDLNDIDQPTTTATDFIGRNKELEELGELSKTARVVLIWGKGGVGKTTLAQKFLESQKPNLLLEIEMAKESRYIDSAEEVIGQLLKYFKEEPSGSFTNKLAQIRQKLGSQKVAILIDNLEPALDKDGKFIEPHRTNYVELLRVLALSQVKSFTLITSRELLCEPDINFENYRLKGLDEQAWKQFFVSKKIETESLALNAIHQYHGGNAKAMTLCCSAIKEDFQGDVEGYWQEHSENLLSNTKLENLVDTQLNRLKKINFSAYKLVLRLGCYHYQRIPKLKKSGLLALLWDRSEEIRNQVITTLRDRDLVEFSNREYWLHPVIRAKAVSRLKSEDENEWKVVNRKIAEFYFNITGNIEDKEQVKFAFEAFDHFFEIQAFDECYKTLLFRILGADKNIENLRCSINIWNYTKRILDMSISIVDNLHGKWKLLTLIPIGICYSDLGKNSEALRVSNDILKIANSIDECNEHIDIVFAKIAAYSIQGRSHRLRGRFQEAVKVCEEASKMAIIFKYPQLKALALYELGRAYLDAKKPGRALTCFVAAAFQAIGIKVSGDIYQFAGRLYQPIEKLYPRIDKVLFKYNPQETISNNIKKFRIIYSIAQSFNLMSSELYPLAEIFAHKALEIAEKTDKSCTTWSYLELAICYSRKGDKDKATEYFKKSEQNLENEDEIFVVVTIRIHIAEWHYQSARYSPEALEEYEKVEKILRNTDFLYLKARTYYGLSLTRHKLGFIGLSFEDCNRALSIAEGLGISLAEECQKLKEELLKET